MKTLYEIFPNYYKIQEKLTTKRDHETSATLTTCQKDLNFPFYD